MKPIETEHPNDDRIIERALGGADASLDRHVEGCARCRRELEAYRDLFGDLRREPPVHALAMLEDADGCFDRSEHANSAREDRSLLVPYRGRLAGFVAIAAVVVALVAGIPVLLDSGVPDRPRVQTTVLRGDVHVSRSGESARVSDADVRFDVEAGPFTLHTPRGSVTCRSGSYRIDVRPSGVASIVDPAGEPKIVENLWEEDVMSKRLATAVRLTVLAGAVLWSSGDDTREVLAGETLVLEASAVAAPEPAPVVEPDPGPAPTPRTEEPPSGDDEATPSVTARVVAKGTDDPVSGATFYYAIPQEDGSALVASGVTDLEGRCTIDFEPMSAEAYAVTEFAKQPVFATSPDLAVRHPGYAPMLQGAHYPVGIPRSRILPTPIGVIDLGDLVLERGAIVSGVVEDASGMPVAGAQVFLSFGGSSEIALPFRVFDAGVSAADGTFVMPDRVNGSGSFMNTLIATTDAGIGWTKLEFPPLTDEVTDARIRIAPTASVRVRVTDADGTPLENVKVGGMPLEPPLGPRDGRSDRFGIYSALRDDDPSRYFFAQTGADGTVELAHLPIVAEVSKYSIWVGREGFLTAKSNPLELAPSMSITRDFVLERASSASVEGRITDSNGAPIAGARVIVFRETVFTDDDGRYRFDDVESRYGQTTIFVRADEFENAHRRIVLRPGQLHSGEDFVIGRTAPITGRLVDTSGRPLPEVTLDFIAEDDRTKGVRADTETDAEGRFVVSKTDDGWWIPRVLRLPDARPGFRWRYYTLPAIRGGSVDVEIVVPEYRLGSTTLTAELFDAATGESVEPAEARMYFDHEGLASNYYDARPRLEPGRVIGEGLWPGDWKLSVLASDGRGVVRVIRIAEGDEDRVERIEFGELAVVSGRVVLDGVEPAPRARAYMAPVGPTILAGWGSDGPQERTSGVLEADCSFRVENVLAGEMVLLIQGMPGYGAAVPLVVEPGGDHHVDVMLEPRTRVTFRTTAPVPALAHYLRIRSLDGIDLDPIGLGSEAVSYRPRNSAGQSPTAEIEAPFDLPEGRYAWEMSFPRHPRTHGSRELALPQSGEFQVTSSEPLEVAVPVVPIEH